MDRISRTRTTTTLRTRFCRTLPSKMISAGDRLSFWLASLDHSSRQNCPAWRQSQRFARSYNSEAATIQVVHASRLPPAGRRNLFHPRRSNGWMSLVLRPHRTLGLVVSSLTPNHPQGAILTRCSFVVISLFTPSSTATRPPQTSYSGRNTGHRTPSYSYLGAASARAELSRSPMFTLLVCTGYPR